MRKLLIFTFLIFSSLVQGQEVVTALRHRATSPTTPTFVKITTGVSASNSISYTCTTGNLLFFTATNDQAGTVAYPTVSSSTDTLSSAGPNEGGSFHEQVSTFAATCGGSGTRTVNWSVPATNVVYSVVAEFSNISSTVVSTAGVDYYGTPLVFSGTNGASGVLGIFGSANAGSSTLTSCDSGFVSAGGGTSKAEVWYNPSFPAGSFTVNCVWAGGTYAASSLASFSH